MFFSQNHRQSKAHFMRLQRLMASLPSSLRRIKVARMLSKLIQADGLHGVKFQSGMVVGHIDEGQVAHSLVRGHFEDHGYFALADDLLSKGGVHFDLGANFGFHTFGLAALANPACEFHLFEANPICCESLRRTIEISGANATLCEGAMGDEEGQASIVFHPGKTVEGRVGRDETAGATKVRSHTLAAYCKRENVSRIRLMKMDIEGSEWHALSGGRSLFSGADVDFCYFEVNQAALAERGISLDLLFAFFEDNHYTLYWPHASEAWIDPRLIPSDRWDTRHYRVGSGSKAVCRLFEPEFLEPQMSHQFDLLAVSPKMDLTLV